MALETGVKVHPDVNESPTEKVVGREAIGVTEEKEGRSIRKRDIGEGTVQC